MQMNEKNEFSASTAFLHCGCFYDTISLSVLSVALRCAPENFGNRTEAAQNRVFPISPDLGAALCPQEACALLCFFMGQVVAV